MRLIVFTMVGSEPEFGDVDKNKFEPQKSDAKTGSLKVNGLETDDSAIYFCAVSNTVCQRLESAVQKHSVHKKTITALVNRWQSGTTNVPHVKTIEVNQKIRSIMGTSYSLLTPIMAICPLSQKIQLVQKYKYK